MAFDYQSLKNITNSAVIDGTVTNDRIAATTVNASNIAATSISSGKFASGAVNLGSTITTGTLAVGNGGTGVGSLGSAYQGFYGDSNFRRYGIYGINVYTSSTTWTKPSGVRFIKVQLTGGGGGGSGHGESGGAGGYSERVLDVRGISSVSVSVAGDVGGTYYAGAGSGGQSTSFGPYLSAGGGYGANQNAQHCGGLSGAGSGGDLNLYGGGGANHHQETGLGGPSYWGGAVAGGYPNGGNFSHNHQSHSAPGSGGSGGYFHGHLGSNGKYGMVVVTMYC